MHYIQNLEGRLCIKLNEITRLNEMYMYVKWTVWEQYMESKTQEIQCMKYNARNTIHEIKCMEYNTGLSMEISQ